VNMVGNSGVEMISGGAAWRHPALARKPSNFSAIAEADVVERRFSAALQAITREGFSP